jgi:hypothetical protein
MRALVVYESTFGNPQVIANAAAGGPASGMRVEAVEVGRSGVGDEVRDEIGPLVVGGPAHPYGPGGPGTRKPAAQPAVSTRTALRGRLAVLPGRPGVAVADRARSGGR